MQTSAILPGVKARHQPPTICQNGTRVRVVCAFFGLLWLYATQQHSCAPTTRDAARLTPDSAIRFSQLCALSGAVPQALACVHRGPPPRGHNHVHRPNLLLDNRPGLHRARDREDHGGRALHRKISGFQCAPPPPVAAQPLAAATAHLHLLTAAASPPPRRRFPCWSLSVPRPLRSHQLDSCLLGHRSRLPHHLPRRDRHAHLRLGDCLSQGPFQPH